MCRAAVDAKSGKIVISCSALIIRLSRGDFARYTTLEQKEFRRVDQDGGHDIVDLGKDKSGRVKTG